MNNLKKLILIFIYVLLATWTLPDLTFAKIMDSREIEIRAKEKKNDPRSLFPVRVWLDGKTVYVTFYELPSTATVTIIKMQNGNDMTTTYQSPQTISLFLDELGEYEIQISYSSKEFVGNFDLE